MDATLDGLRGASLELFSAAREAGQYEVAYHALCAAGLDRPARPEHRLSTQSAQARGHEGIFRQLTVTAESARLRIGLQKRQGRPKAPLAAAKS